MIEIERKFLVNGNAYKEESGSRIHIVQGFLSTDPDRTIRVRCIGPHGFLTIKGRTYDQGTSRQEWEYEIPLDEAKELLAICEMPPIEKIRYQVTAGRHTFEVDEFMGINQGLILAEIELEAASAAFDRPAWLGKEVTGEPRYYNSQLSLNPFISWKEE